MNEIRVKQDRTASRKLRRVVRSFDISRLVVGLFFVLLLLLTTGQELPGTMTNISARIGMHGILVLAMVPSIRAGLGPNFSVPFGILAGLLGGLIPIELNMKGMPAFLLALACAAAFSFPCGLLYGYLMNRVKKSEMMVATYFGYAMVAIMCIGWLMLPFGNKAITWSMGSGLRNTINLDFYFRGALSNIWKIHVDFAAGDVLRLPVGFIAVLLLALLASYLASSGKPPADAEGLSEGQISAFKRSLYRRRIAGNAFLASSALLCLLCYLFPHYGVFSTLRDALTLSHALQYATMMEIPTGMLLFFLFCCLLVWAFFKSKTGIAMTATGANPDCARASGVNVDRQHVIGATFSTMLVSIGILVYAQQFGFLQLYNAPLTMCFPPIAAILIGGASIREAKVIHALIGVLLFQGILTMGPSVAARYLSGLGEGIDPTEIVRIIITNGIILYALAKAGGSQNAG